MRSSIKEATDYGVGIDSSTLAIARLLGATPKKLAEALYSDDENAEFRASLTASMITVKVAKDREATKAKNA